MVVDRLVAIGLFVGLHDSAELLLPHLEVGGLDLFDCAVDAVDFELVGVNLRLVVFELGNQVLQLLAPVLQVLLVLGQLFGHVGAALLGQNVFKLDVELLFLLD